MLVRPRFTTLVLIVLLAVVPQATAEPPAVDWYGDALPEGATARLGTVRYRFPGGVFEGIGLAFLPDNETIVSVRDSSLTFWEAKTGKKIREIDTSPLTMGGQNAFSRGAKRVAFSGFLRDGNKGSRNCIRILDVTTGKVVRTLPRESDDNVHALVLSPDGELLFSLGWKGIVRIHEVATGFELLTQKVPRDNGGYLALSPDGTTLAISTGANTRKLYLWKWQAAEDPRELKTPFFRGGRLTFSPDSTLLVDCSDATPTVRVWDVVGGRLLRKLELPDHASYRHSFVEFSPDGKVLAAAGRTNERGAVHLWNPRSGKFLRRLDLDGGQLAFSPNGKLLVVGTLVWDFASDKELSSNDKAHRGAVGCIAKTGRNLVATGSDDKTIRLWDANSGEHERTLVLDSWIRNMAVSPDGRHLVSNSLGDSVVLWDVATGKATYRLAGHGRLGGERATAFTSDGKFFFTFGDDMYLRKWEVRTGKALVEHALRPTGVEVPEEDAEPFERGFPFHLESCQFTPDTKQLVVVANRTLFVFDTKTGKELRSFSTEVNHVTGMALSSDSQWIAVSGWSKSEEKKSPDGKVVRTTPKNHPVLWWDLHTGKRIGKLDLPGRGAGVIAFAPTGKTLAVASPEPTPTIRTLDLPNSRVLDTIDGFRCTVWSLAYTPDGNQLLSGMSDSTALIWNLER